MANGYINHEIEDLRVSGYTLLTSPSDLKGQIPLTDRARETVKRGRQSIRDILGGYDSRLILVTGPCSVHDPKADIEYAGRLKGLEEKVGDRFVVVKRTYFEKPRTTVGWKGLIYEPDLDGRVNINKGLSLARGLLRDIAEIGIPAGTEFLDPFVPQYIDNLVSWGAIGARTVESPLHRQMASGLSMPIGLKNDTHGDVRNAVNAVLSARLPQGFFGLHPDGRAAEVTTLGNPDTHIVLRGGNGSPNYDGNSVREAQAMLRESGLGDRLMIDCSHGNSNKDHELQPVVFQDVIRQRVDGNRGIIGIMLESNIYEGRQDIPANLKDLRYGVSVTDACIGWETTEKLVLDAYKTLAKT